MVRRVSVSIGFEYYTDKEIKDIRKFWLNIIKANLDSINITIFVDEHEQ